MDWILGTPVISPRLEAPGPSSPPTRSLVSCNPGPKPCLLNGGGGGGGDVLFFVCFCVVLDLVTFFCFLDSDFPSRPFSRSQSAFLWPPDALACTRTLCADWDSVSNNSNNNRNNRNNKRLSRDYRWPDRPLLRGMVVAQLLSNPGAIPDGARRRAPP